MGMIEIPEDFRPEFSQTYNFEGQEFSIQIQYRGVFLDEETQKTYNYWAFKLILPGGFVVVAGPHRQATDDRELTRENVANNLASFYGYGIKNLIIRSRSEQAIIQQPDTLDEIVELCREYMFREFYDGPFTADFGYTVIHKELLPIGAWSVIFETDKEPNKWFHFSRETKTSRIYIKVYLKAHQHSIPKF